MGSCCSQPTATVGSLGHSLQSLIPREGGSGVQLLCFLRLILSFGMCSQAEPVCSSGQLWGSLHPWAQGLILGDSMLL